MPGGRWHLELRGFISFVGPLDGIIFQGEQCGSCVGICLWFVSCWRQLSAPLAVCFQLELSVCSAMVRYILEQRVFLYGTYMKYGSARKCRRKFRCKFRDKEFPADKQFTIWWINLDQRDS
jgi:hypothetical protein